MTAYFVVAANADRVYVLQFEPLEKACVQFLTSQSHCLTTQAILGLVQQEIIWAFLHCVMMLLMPSSSKRGQTICSALPKS